MSNVIRLNIEKKLPLMSGTSRASGKAWKKQNYVGKTLEQYPRTVMFSVFGDAVDSVKCEEGKTYDVSIDIESRSYNINGAERWSTDVNAWKAELVGADQTPATAPQPQQQTQMDKRADAYFSQQPQPQQRVVTPQPSSELPF